MSTKTTIAGGILILAGGLALAIYANTNTAALADAKARIVTKYITLSQKALNEGDSAAAEKFAKQALATDPKNKEALKSFKSVVLASCPKAAATSGTAAPAAAPTNSTAPAAEPVAPEAEPEEEMGCI